MVDATGTEAVIQGVTAPMVAVPGPGQALMARSAGFGGTMPGMSNTGQVVAELKVVTSNKLCEPIL